MDKILLLKNTAIFSPLDGKVLNLIAENLERLEIPKGGIIFEEGAVADSFYIVEEGEVTIYKKLKGDKKKDLSAIKMGGVFGEMAFFSDLPRTAAAQAGAKCVLLRLGRDRFFDIIEKRPGEGIKIFSKLLEVAMGRLERTSRELAAIYETGRIISKSNTLAEISSSVAEELLASFPQATHSEIFFYNEFNDDFENPRYEPLPPDNPLVRLLADSREGKGIIYPLTSGDKTSYYAAFLKDAASFIAVPILRRRDDAKGLPVVGFIILWREDSAHLSPGEKIFSDDDFLLLCSVSSQLSESYELLRRREEELNRARLKSGFSG